MLVFGVAVESVDRWLQNVGGRRQAVRHPPALAIAEKRRLRLRTGEAELSVVSRYAPGRLIPPEDAQAFGNLPFGQPVDVLTVAPQNLVDPFRAYQLNGTGTVLADRTKQREGVAGRYLEPLAPASQIDLVVGKQSP